MTHRQCRHNRKTCLIIWNSGIYPNLQREQKVEYSLYIRRLICFFNVLSRRKLLEPKLWKLIKKNVRVHGILIDDELFII